MEVDVNAGAAKIIGRTDVGQVIDPYNLKMQLEVLEAAATAPSPRKWYWTGNRPFGNNLVDVEVFPSCRFLRLIESCNDLSAFGGINGQSPGLRFRGAVSWPSPRHQRRSSLTRRSLKGIRKKAG